MSAPSPRPSSEDRVRAALWFSGRGFGIFPCWSTTADGTCRCPQGASCHSPGKHPLTNDGFKSATTDAKRITTFLSAASEPNYGLVAPEGVFVLDVDGEGWQAKLAGLEAKHGPLPPTLRDDTANGQHIFLRWPDDHPRPLRQLFGWVTRWGSGAHAGYVIGPRSVHASGAEYRPSAGAVAEIATLPDAWAKAGVADDSHQHITVGDGQRHFGTVTAGGRHEFLRDRARTLRGGGLGGEALFVAVMELNEQYCSPPKDAEEVRRAIGDVETKFAPDPIEAEPRRRQAPKVYGPTMDAAELLGLDLPPLRMIVPGLLPEGTAILAGPPKLGKSCLVYQMAVEVSVGGELFGERVVSGSALYLALEDGKRRGQERIRAALDGRTLPWGRLDIRWDAPKIGEGLEEMLVEWLEAHHDAAFVAIDTLGRVRPRSSGKRNSYEVDVEDVGRVQSICRDRAVALVLVHHTKKDRGDDFVAEVSGTYGVSGSVDTNIVIARPRLKDVGKIIVTGREIAEAEIIVSFDGFLWHAAPEAMADASYERRTIFEIIKQQGPIHAKAISEQTGQRRESVQQIISALHGDGLVDRVTGGYTAAGYHRVSSTPPYSTASQSNGRKGGDEARVRAREADVESTVLPTPRAGVDCRDYPAHQSHHRRLDGETFTCDVCHPPEEEA